MRKSANLLEGQPNLGVDVSDGWSESFGGDLDNPIHGIHSIMRTSNFCLLFFNYTFIVLLFEDLNRLEWISLFKRSKCMVFLCMLLI